MGDNLVIENETTAVATIQSAGVDPWVGVVERAARDPAVDADKLIKLYELSERAQAARARAAFDTHFVLMQAKLPRIDRKGQIVVYSKADRERQGGPPEGAVPQQRTPYARLEDIVEAISPVLSEHGFSLSHRIDRTAENMVCVTGILTHREGHSERTSFPLPHDSSGSKNNVQAVGSSITYGRRYTTLSLLNIVSHAPVDADDDAKRAGKPEPIDAEKVKRIEGLLTETGTVIEVFLTAMAVDSIEAMTPAKYAEAEALLLRKKAGAGRKVAQ